MLVLLYEYLHNDGIISKEAFQKLEPCKDNKFVLTICEKEVLQFLDSLKKA